MRFLESKYQTEEWIHIFILQGEDFKGNPVKDGDEVPTITKKVSSVADAENFLCGIVESIATDFQSRLSSVQGVRFLVRPSDDAGKSREGNMRMLVEFIADEDRMHWCAMYQYPEPKRFKKALMFAGQKPFMAILGTGRV